MKTLASECVSEPSFGMQIITIDFAVDDDESVVDNEAPIYRIRETYWIFGMPTKQFMQS